MLFEKFEEMSPNEGETILEAVGVVTPVLASV